MYIAPNSTVKLLSNVPLDPTYDHTIYFETKTQQYNWFNNYLKTGMTFERQYYQRHSRGYIKLEVLADNVYDCNYLMFRNTSFGNKWFYAFITNVEYVNDSVTLIQYEIDVMQTWFFDYTLGECFVERQHSATDQIGDNLIPENLPTGELQYASEERILWHDFQSTPGGDDLCVVVAAPFDKTGANANGSVTSGMYSGLYYNIFSDGSTPILDQLLDFFDRVRVAVKADQIVTMFYYFKEFALQPSSNPNNDEPNRGYVTKDVVITKDSSGFKNDYNDEFEIPYVPKNNKVYTAPYNYLTITDYNGHSVDYMYEFFNSENCEFYVSGGLSVQPAIGIIPKVYMGQGHYGAGKGNTDFAFWYKDFPKIPWNSDGFIAYLAQTGAALLGSATVDLATMGITGIAGESIASDVAAVNRMNSSAEILNTPAGQPVRNTSMSAPNYGGGGISPMAIKGIMGGAAVAALRGRRVHGSSLPSHSWSINNIRVSAVRKKIRAEYARIIDDYFSMYGYACNQLTIPHTNVRDRWTYVKTANCVLAENKMPADDARKVCSIYNNGITFWTWYATVGDYTQDNPCRIEMINP